MNFLFKKYDKKIRNVLYFVLSMLLAWLLFFGHKYQFMFNTGTSMEPTIQHLEWMVAQKRSDLGKDWTPDRLDLVLIKNGMGDILTKRVIGLPNDTISYKMVFFM